MKSLTRRKWIAAFYFIILPSVDPQVAMYPMFPPQMHVAVPMPVPFPVVIRGNSDVTITTTTTTTTERNRLGFAFPVGVPMPFAFPAFPAMACQPNRANNPTTTRPKNCPPCPPCLCTPSCTPAFFSYCSPCHQKCRCHSKEETPEPMTPRPPIMGPSYGIAMPAPMFAPPPVFIIPFPPSRPGRRPGWPSTSSSDYTDTDCGSTESDSYYTSISSHELKRRKRKKVGHSKRRPSHRRTFTSMEISDNELVKPVLTYISRNGDVKIKRRLSNDEAAALMNDKPFQKINVLTGQDDANQPRILITSRNEKNPRTAQNHRRKQVLMTSETAQHILGDGRKELVFRPPGGKTISNLSVSFQISE